MTAAKTKDNPGEAKVKESPCRDLDSQGMPTKVEVLQEDLAPKAEAAKDHAEVAGSVVVRATPISAQDLAEGKSECWHR